MYHYFSDDLDKDTIFEVVSESDNLGPIEKEQNNNGKFKKN